ncbi:hypothetical protein FJINLJCC_00133 [Ostreid herpesvirus 1]|nr:hypothetical protein LKIMDMGE_00006 [Ostreid herpesvirus 1]UPX72297.1 hypothetical protein LKIMDMGE_00132 [Ostreid herpesvirus 1]UPX72490.1 hypothetical protein CEAEFCCE_00005 [Ostreid herpesvirus 1]UPX72617.1 hypothetical protein CEAEFCCE_00132 [Ostreid herpesvirus 1]UPX72651.1 hypothetical protein FJINLJCC_00006 [Ostreid herpesvirus 1]
MIILSPMSDLYIGLYNRGGTTNGPRDTEVHILA